ncbi:MAG: CHAT domain-containing protein [Ignavibacteria bacterium]|nr:CHAT domain-containing protein [Ignavibacteria bacterium]
MEVSYSDKMKNAEKLFSKGISLKANSRFYEAEKIFRKVYKDFKELKDYEKYSSCLNELGTVLIHLGGFSESSGFLNTALKETLRIKNRKLYADVIGNIGIIKIYQEKYDEAKDLFEEELRINIKRKDQYRIQLALGKIGNVYTVVNDLKSAIYYFEKQKDLCIKTGNDKFLTYALSGLATCYLHKHEYEKSLTYFRESIPICEKINEQRGLSLALTNTGYVYFLKQDYDHALNFYNRALAINIKLKNKRDLIYIYGLLGSLLQEKKEFSKSVFYYRKQYDLSVTLKMFRLKSIALAELGKIFKEKNDFESAQKYFKRQLALCRKNNLVNGLYFALENNGQILMLKKNYRSSLKYFDEQTALSKKVFGVNHFYTSRALKNKGDLFTYNGLFRDGLLLYQRALICLSEGFSSLSIENNPSPDNVLSEPDLFEILTAKASALKKYYETGKKNVKYLKLSLLTYEAALNTVGRMRLGFKEQGSKFTMSGNVIPFYEQAIDTAYKLFEITNEEAYIEKAFFLAGKNKAAVLLESMRETEAKIISGLPENLLDKKKFFKNEMSLLEKARYDELSKGKSASKKIITGLEEKIFKFKSEYNAFIEMLEKDFPGYYNLKYEMPETSVREIRNKIIDEKNVFIEYFTGEKYIFIFVITDIDFKVMKLPRRKSFDKSVHEVRQSLTGISLLDFTSNRKKFTSAAYKLYMTLIHPIIEEIKNKSHLIIIPDNIINLIPLEVLISEIPQSDHNYNDLHYLIKDYTVSYAYSSVFLLKNKSARKRSGDLKVAGFAPDFVMNQRNIEMKEDAAGKEFISAITPLSFNEAELNEIKNIFKSDYYFKEDATKKSFLMTSGKHSIIHLATHCIVDDKNPLFSRICFSQNKDSDSESYLYNYELFNLKLNSDLVVLSACHTGSGKLVKGKGILSIARGFAYSGCSSIVMSLWQVNDESTSAIMGNFYKNLSEGKKIDESLRMAKLSYLEKADGFHSSPFFWAPFVVAGNADIIVS